MTAVLSIGALSQATGVPAETLRTWERRYGFPTPIERKGTRHRRYPLATVERIRLAVMAMDRGHKPSVALTASAEQLRQLLSLHGEDLDMPEATPERTGRLPADHVARLFAPMMRFDNDGFRRAMHHAWNDLGAEVFAEQCAGPYLTEVGERWERGEISVAHEHFSSEQMRSFLAARWNELSEGVRGPRIVCATPDGEQHTLGLHLAATALAAGDAEIVFLGASTPVDDVVRAVVERDAIGVALSASSCADPDVSHRYLDALRDALPRSITLIVGGSGLEEVGSTVFRPENLADLTRWVRSRRPTA